VLDQIKSLMIAIEMWV